MKQKTYVVLYSLIVNGEEYPRQMEIPATSPDDAKSKLKDLINDQCEYNVNQVTLK